VVVYALTLAASAELGQAESFVPADVIRVTLSGDRTVIQLGTHRALVEGHAVLQASGPSLPLGQVVVHADRLESTAQGQEATVSAKGAKLLYGPALVAGADLWLDVGKGEFRLDQARGYMVLPRPPTAICPGTPTAYFAGRRVAKTGSVSYVLGASMTLCDRDDPHYQIRARRIKFDEGTGEIIMDHAKLRLYGLDIPLVPWVKYGVGPSGQRRGIATSTPGYSSREGWYLPVARRFTGLDEPWTVATSLHITARKGIIGTVWAERTVDDGVWSLRASRKEWVTDKLEDRLGLSRLPEVGYERALTPTGHDGRLILDLTAGNYKEDLETQHRGQPPRPQICEQRVMGSLEYVAHSAQFEARRGNWYGATGRLGAYSSGDRYADLEVFAGIGGRLGDCAKSHLTVRHHFTGGETPFLFDDVDMKTELDPGLSLQLNEKWGINGWGRFDLHKEDLRDYEISLRRRLHCLSWDLYYRAVGNNVGMRVNLNGLTGDTEPFVAKSAFQAQMEEEGLSVRPATLEQLEQHWRAAKTRAPPATAAVTPKLAPASPAGAAPTVQP
jgi:hypothetical protein